MVILLIASYEYRWACADRKRALLGYRDDQLAPGTSGPSIKMAGMSGRAVKTEAVVLRSMRYGEADRIMHLYTPDRGRVSAIAKGVRRVRSRFGGRLEPFFRLRIELHEGRGELLTVTGAQTVDGHARLRGDARALDAAARACDAVGRLFETSEPHPGVFNLLSRKLSLLDAGQGGVHSGRAAALAFRLKLLLAAGLAPQLG